MEIIWGIQVYHLIWFTLLSGSLLLVFRQLRLQNGQLQTQTHLLQSQLLAERHKMFLALTDCITPDMYTTMSSHLADHFDLQVYQERYAQDERKIKSYFLMKRKYVYLFFTFTVEDGFPIPTKGITEQWLAELANYQEFHDVHARQRVYYPTFAALVDRIIGSRCPVGWMCEQQGSAANRVGVE